MKVKPKYEFETLLGDVKVALAKLRFQIRDRVRTAEAAVATHKKINDDTRVNLVLREDENRYLSSMLANGVKPLIPGVGLEDVRKGLEENRFYLEKINHHLKKSRDAEAEWYKYQSNLYSADTLAAELDSVLEKLHAPATRPDPEEAPVPQAPAV